ncbi:MAG: hypothetical protein WAK55_20270 [Xanthobacteraceae bacterium]
MLHRFSLTQLLVAEHESFVVKDSGGQKLGYFYYEEEPGRRSTAKMLTKDEAKDIAMNFANLPEPFRSNLRMR